MTPFLLASLEAAHATAAPGLAEKFGLDPKYIAIQALSFLIVMAVLYKLSIKPTIAKMEERQHKIAEGLRHAEAMKAKLAEAEAESKARLDKASLEAQGIVAESRQAAKDLLEKHTAEATERASRILEKAREATELERKKMLEEVRAEIARLVVLTTSRVLSRELDDQEKRRYTETAARELAET